MNTSIRCGGPPKSRPKNSHSSRMNGLGNDVRSRDAFISMPRISNAKGQLKKR